MSRLSDQMRVAIRDVMIRYGNPSGTALLDDLAAVASGVAASYYADASEDQDRMDFASVSLDALDKHYDKSWECRHEQKGIYPERPTLREAIDAARESEGEL